MTTTLLTEFIELVDRDEELHRLRDEVARQEAELEALTTERDNLALQAEGQVSALAEQYDLLREELVAAHKDFHEALNQRDAARELHDRLKDVAEQRKRKYQLHIEELERALSHVSVMPPPDDKVTDLTAFIAELREWLALSKAEATELRKRNSDQARKVTKLNEENRELREQRETLQLRLDVERNQFDARLDAVERLHNKDYNAVLVELAAAKSDRDRYKSKARRKIYTPRFQFHVSETAGDIITLILVLTLLVILPAIYIATH